MMKNVTTGMSKESPFRYQEMHRESWPRKVVRQRFPSLSPVYSVLDPAEAKRLLDHKDCQAKPMAVYWPLRYMWSDGPSSLFVAQTGTHTHTQMRKATMVAMHPRAIEAAAAGGSRGGAAALIDELVAAAGRAADEAQPWDALDECTYFTLDVISSLAFGYRLGCLSNAGGETGLDGRAWLADLQVGMTEAIRQLYNPLLKFRPWLDAKTRAARAAQGRMMSVAGAMLDHAESQKCGEAHATLGGAIALVHSNVATRNA
jgi:cytochrome P450